VEVNLNIIMTVIGVTIYFMYKAKQNRLKWEAYYRASTVLKDLKNPNGDSYQDDYSKQLDKGEIPVFNSYGEVDTSQLYECPDCIDDFDYCSRCYLLMMKRNIC
jgi:hypothetical protein